MRNEGINWNKEQEDRKKSTSFKEHYTEQHIKTERIREAPSDDTVYQEGGQQATILSDGENGRIATISHKELIRCDCGCIVDDIMKTRRDKNGKILCERHANLFCRLCSLVIVPEEQVKINESYYHKRCAEKVIDKILDEAAIKHGKLSPAEIGELKALKRELVKERIENYQKKAKAILKRIFGKSNGILKK